MLDYDTLQTYVTSAYEEIIEAVLPGYVGYQTSSFTMTIDDEGDEIPVLPLEYTVVDNRAYPFNIPNALVLRDVIDSYGTAIQKPVIEAMADIIADKVMHRLADFIRDNIEVTVTIPANSINVTGIAFNTDAFGVVTELGDVEASNPDSITLTTPTNVTIN